MPAAAGLLTGGALSALGLPFSIGLSVLIGMMLAWHLLGLLLQRWRQHLDQRMAENRLQSWFRQSLNGRHNQPLPRDPAGRRR